LMPVPITPHASTGLSAVREICLAPFFNMILSLLCSAVSLLDLSFI